MSLSYECSLLLPLFCAASRPQLLKSDKSRINWLLPAESHQTTDISILVRLYVVSFLLPQHVCVHRLYVAPRLTAGGIET